MSKHSITTFVLISATLSLLVPIDRRLSLKQPTLDHAPITQKILESVKGVDTKNPPPYDHLPDHLKVNPIILDRSESISKDRATSRQITKMTLHLYRNQKNWNYEEGLKSLAKDVSNFFGSVYVPKALGAAKFFGVSSAPVSEIWAHFNTLEDSNWIDPTIDYTEYFLQFLVSDGSVKTVSFLARPCPSGNGVCRIVVNKFDDMLQLDINQNDLKKWLEAIAGVKCSPENLQRVWSRLTTVNPGYSVTIIVVNIDEPLSQGMPEMETTPETELDTKIIKDGADRNSIPHQQFVYTPSFMRGFAPPQENHSRKPRKDGADKRSIPTPDFYQGSTSVNHRTEHLGGNAIKGQDPGKIVINVFQPESNTFDRNKI